jgi:glutamyl/glutaminyl-tRNA synthetase
MESGDNPVPPDHVDDFILLKQELTPSYNFAAAIDDMSMGITDVIRGGDHISNTPKQIMLFETLGKRPPKYAHHSLLVGSDKKPLSKRHGATRITEFRDMGILNSALINYIGILGRVL